MGFDQDWGYDELGYFNIVKPEDDGARIGSRTFKTGHGKVRWRVDVARGSGGAAEQPCGRDALPLVYAAPVRTGPATLALLCDSACSRAGTNKRPALSPAGLPLGDQPGRERHHGVQEGRGHSGRRDPAPVLRVHQGGRELKFEFQFFQLLPLHLRLRKPGRRSADFVTGVTVGMTRPRCVHHARCVSVPLFIGAMGPLLHVLDCR